MQVCLSWCSGLTGFVRVAAEASRVGADVVTIHPSGQTPVDEEDSVEFCPRRVWGAVSPPCHEEPILGGFPCLGLQGFVLGFRKELPTVALALVIVGCCRVRRRVDHGLQLFLQLAVAVGEQ